MLKSLISSVVTRLRFLIHQFFFKSGLITHFGLLAAGESKKNSINPLFVTADATESDFNLIFTPEFVFPFSKNEYRFIYSSHNLEHLNKKTSDRLFSECYRILSSGGELSIEVPNCEFIYNAYKDYLKNKSSDDIDKLCNFRFPKEVEENVKNFQNLDQYSIEKNLNTVATKVSSFLSCYCHPVYTGAHTPIVMEEKVFNQKFNDLDMDDFFVWCTDNMNEEQKLSGGHITAWYPSKLIKKLESFNFDVKIRGYRESRLFNRFLGKFLVLDRKHRGFYSFRLSAIKKS